MATLRVYRGDQFVAPFELGEGRTRIGRGTDNHLVLEDHDKQVSRIHAEIWHERGRYVIADLNSQNGVWIGERQIKTEEPLPENVPITIGPYRLILEASAPTVVADAVDGAEMTRESGAFVEPTQLVDAVSSAPPPSAHSQATKIPTANLPATPKSKLVPLLALGALAALAVFALVIFMTGRKTGEMNPAGDNNPTPRAPESTTTIPPNKTAEEIFQEHFTQAQLLLEAQNPAAAKEENRLALDALPDDPRGLAQQRGIEGILNPPPPDPATARSKPSVDANAKPDGTTAARDKIEEGKRALDERRYADAINLLEEAGRLAGSGNAPIELNDLLARAKSGRAAEVQRERQGNAQKALDEARVSAGSDVLHGVQKLQEARTLNPELAGIGDVEALLLQQARSQGTAALALAKNRHNDGRTEEASKLYTRAIQLLSLLPGGHEGIAEAKQRLDQLKAVK